MAKFKPVPFKNPTPAERYQQQLAGMIQVIENTQRELDNAKATVVRLKDDLKRWKQRLKEFRASK